MSQNNQERIQQIWVEITQWEKQKESGVSLATQAQIDSDISSAKAEIARLETEDQVAMNETIQQDHVSRVSSVATQFDKFLDDMDLGGMSLREVIGGIKEYQLVSIELKKAYMSQAETFSGQLSEQQALHSEQMRGAQERETQLQRQNEILQAKVSNQEGQLSATNIMLNQERIERANAEQTRDNAVAQLDEANKQIAQQKGHIDDLRNEIALGARGAINVVDTAEEEAQKRELAEQIRKERTIYNVEWVDEIKRTRKKAFKAATGEPIDFPYYEETKYFVIPESEVSQFREQYAITVNPEVPDVVEEPVQASIAEGVQFQTVTAPIVGPIQIPGQPADSGVETEATEGFATKEWVKSQLAALEARITGETAA